MQDGGQPERQVDVVVPPFFGDDVQLLWSLGIPVYQDGRVEVERVAKVYREVVFPELNRLREDNLRCRTSSGAEANLVQCVADLMSHIQAAGERLDQREREQMGRAGTLAAAAKSLLERMSRVSEDLDRCETTLDESRDLLAKAQRLDETAQRVEALIGRGEKLSARIDSFAHEAESAAELYDRAHRMLNLALAAEGETRRMADEAARRLRAALDLAIDGFPARITPHPVDPPLAKEAEPAADEATTPPPAAGDEPAQETPMEVIKQVHFVSESLLPASRFQVKRRLMELLGDDRVLDAPDGRDLLISCEREEVGYVTAATLGAAVELGIELQMADATPELTLTAALDLGRQQPSAQLGAEVSHA